MPFSGLGVFFGLEVREGVTQLDSVRNVISKAKYQKIVGFFLLHLHAWHRIWSFCSCKMSWLSLGESSTM